MKKSSLSSFCRTLTVLLMASPLCVVHAGSPRGISAKISANQGSGNSGNSGNTSGRTYLGKTMTPRVIQNTNISTPLNTGNLGGKSVFNRPLGGKLTPIVTGGNKPFTPFPGTINPMPGSGTGNNGGNNSGGGKGPRPFPGLNTVPGSVFNPISGGKPPKGPDVTGPLNPFPGTVNPFPGGGVKPPKGPDVVGPLDPFPGTIDPGPANPPSNPPTNPPNTPPTTPPTNPPQNPPGNGGGNGNGHGHHKWHCWRPWYGCYGNFHCPVVQPIYLPMTLQTLPVAMTRDLDLCIVSASIVEPPTMMQGALVRLQIMNKGPSSLDLPARVGLFGAEMNQMGGDLPSTVGQMQGLAVGATATMDLRMPLEAKNKPVLIVAIELPEGYRDLNEQDNVAQGELAKLPVATVSSR